MSKIKIELFREDAREFIKILDAAKKLVQKENPIIAEGVDAVRNQIIDALADQSTMKELQKLIKD